jgi:D-proline reductase (dithiol) PrdB
VELEAEGTIGRLAPGAVSMVGSITKFTELIQKTAPAIKEVFDAQEVDLVFLFPF